MLPVSEIGTTICRSAEAHEHSWGLEAGWSAGGWRGPEDCVRAALRNIALKGMRRVREGAPRPGGRRGRRGKGGKAHGEKPPRTYRCRPPSRGNPEGFLLRARSERAMQQAGRTTTARGAGRTVTVGGRRHPWGRARLRGTPGKGLAELSCSVRGRILAPANLMHGVDDSVVQR